MNLFLTLSGSAFEWTWRTSARVTVLIALVFLAQKLLGRRLTPGSRYALSLLVLIGLLLPWVPPSPFSLGNLFPASASFWKRATVPPVSALLSEPARLVLGTGGAPVQARVQANGRGLSFYEAAGLAWFSGCVCLLVIAAWRYWRWKSWIREGRPITEPSVLELLEQARRSMRVRRPVALAAVDQLSSPAVFGVRRVRLLLPEGVLRQLSLPELRLVFLHELAHVRRNDLLLNWVLMAAQFLHWFNPLVWLALHRLRADRELVCDALVLQQVGPAERLGYGQVLLKLMAGFSMEHRVFSSAVPVRSSRREMKRRIVMIKHHRKPGVAGRFGTALLVVAVGCATLTRAREENADRTKNPAPLVPPPAPAKPILLAQEEPPYSRQPPLQSVRPEPTQAQTTGAQDLPPLVVSIDADGNLRLGPEGRRVTLDQLKTELASEVGKNADLRLSLSVNQRAPYAQIEKVLAVAREAKVRAVNFSAKKGTFAIFTIEHVGPAAAGDELVPANNRLKPEDHDLQPMVDALVRRLYATGRYYNIRVASADTPEGRVVTFIVQDNPQVIDIKFHGNKKFSDAKLREKLTTKVGEPFSERKLFTDSQEIQKTYQTAGYPQAAVKYSYRMEEAAGRVTVTFEISE